MIIDVNVYLERWPFRRLPCDRADRLLEKLDACGVTQAWAGSFDGLLHRDMGGVNARLAEACRKHGAGRLIPFGSVNPWLPDWKEDLRRCHEEHGMPGIRLHPNYHGYQLENPDFAELLALAERRDLIVQLCLRMEDVRMQHPIMPVPDVRPEPILDLMKELPKLRLVLLSALRMRGKILTQFVEAGNVYFEISMLEGVQGISNLLQRIPVERVLFGSHFPLFHLESALLKLQESDLPQAARDAITHASARRLLGR
jgi:predicted TIM-barrel fold metal-dependent hydrolase